MKNIKNTKGKEEKVIALVNQQIKAPMVRVLDEQGEMLGVLKLEEAIDKAYDLGLDLVEVSPNSNPPVCKIMDFGKFKYQAQKKLHEAKKKQKVIILKEVQLSLNIGEHDYNVKLKNTIKFIENEYKVKVAIRLRGRELANKEKAVELLQKFFQDVGGEEVVKYELPPKIEGNNVNMILVKVK